MLPFFYAILAGLSIARASPPPAQVTSINVSSKAKQGDAHLIEIPGQLPILIDTGSIGEGLVAYLRQRKIKRIRDIIVSHVHEDHYGALFELIGEPIKIDRVWINLPPHDVCDREIPWGCHYHEVKFLQKLLRERQVSVAPLKAGQWIIRGNSAQPSLQVLALYDGINATAPIGNTDVNDTSSILRLTVGKMRMLFTGDLNFALGSYLAKTPAFNEFLPSDIIKVPHHGAKSLPPNSFFEKVNANMAVIPVPVSIWQTPRCQQTRDYYTSQLKPECLLVNGLAGSITLSLYPDHAEGQGQTPGGPVNPDPPRCRISAKPHS